MDPPPPVLRSRKGGVVFKIGIHSKDVEILEGFKSYFKVGKIRFENNRNVASYVVETPKELF